MRNYRVTIVNSEGKTMGIIVKAASEKAVRTRLVNNPTVKEIVSIR